jgi:hypothetical protein
MVSPVSQKVCVEFRLVGAVSELTHLSKVALLPVKADVVLPEATCAEFEKVTSDILMALLGFVASSCELRFVKAVLAAAILVVDEPA